MKTAVIKLSGKTLNGFLTSNFWMKAIHEIHSNFDGIIIVHGAGKNITQWSTALGLENKFVNGHRVTTGDQMDVVAAVQAGLVNTKITARLNASGFDAVGLSGIDRSTFVAAYMDKSMGFVGRPVLSGSVDWILNLIKENSIPVFSSVCRDADGNLMNVNADLFAETLALAIKADTVFFISDVDGVKINGEVKQTLTEPEINEGISSGDITDGMIPKLTSCTSLLKKGIHKIWIGSQIKLPGENNSNSENGGTWIITTEREYEFLSLA